MKTALGPEHPNTITLRGNYQALLMKTGQAEKAAAIAPQQDDL